MGDGGDRGDRGHMGADMIFVKTFTQASASRKLLSKKNLHLIANHLEELFKLHRPASISVSHLREGIKWSLL